MNKKRFLLLAILVMGVLIWGAYNTKLGQNARRGIGLVRTERLSYIGILQAHEFDLKLVNGKRIHARLQVESSPDAKPKLIHLINHCHDPRVVMYEFDEEEKIWIVEILVTPDNSLFETSISDWLEQNGLIWKEGSSTWLLAGYNP